MAGDDLNAPLGFARESGLVTAPVVRDLPWGAFALGGMGILGASLVAFMIVTDDGAGGYPRVVTPIEYVSPPKQIRVPDMPESRDDVTASVSTARRALGNQVETESGVKVVRRGGGDAPGALIIRIPDEIGVQLAPAPDRRLVEKGTHGPLPKIGADGARPSEVYARPLIMPTNMRAGAPRIAIVVGGMGLSQTATSGAIDKLPAAVTLAFAPYGSDLAQQAATARTAGHEILLQSPMEGFDKDAGGARALLTDASAAKTIDTLHWQMSRFPGYVGVTNFLGARFTTSQNALSPVMREIGDRGLLFFDDGSSPQSLAPTVAAAAGVSASRADVVIDASQRAEDIEAALQRLEKLAREKGTAIGMASGLPQTVERIARFTQGLEQRGVALVPLTAVIAPASRTSAR
ncbi:MAG: divergent polysaccharide deacetylase family protein [Beijerinckiaceae bacterium]|nr:divergent polysaccharide deacetylase family protein [Beijerinckiaceae bacterium]